MLQQIKADLKTLETDICAIPDTRLTMALMGQVNALVASLEKLQAEILTRADGLEVAYVWAESAFEYEIAELRKLTT